MEWTEHLRSAIAYIEAHLLDSIRVEDVAKEAHISSLYLQKGFKIMTGYSVGEYIRCRRLYLAALDVIAGREKVIDLALKYGYETPESFSKAFGRFHGVSPKQLKENRQSVRTFLPLKIKLSVWGGDDMEYFVEKMNGFQVIGFERICSEETSATELPEFWDEFWEIYWKPLQRAGQPRNLLEQIIHDCNVGEFGICIDDAKETGMCRYLIAGRYNGQEVPEGMTIFAFPDLEWAKFRCAGPMPGAIQAVYARIFQEWLPGNPDYEIAMGSNIEWYAKGDNSRPDYESEIWIPVISRGFVKFFV